MQAFHARPPTGRQQLKRPLTCWRAWAAMPLHRQLLFDEVGAWKLAWCWWWATTTCAPSRTARVQRQHAAAVAPFGRLLVPD